jgi:hypothetical protein
MRKQVIIATVLLATAGAFAQQDRGSSSSGMGSGIGSGHPIPGDYKTPYNGGPGSTDVSDNANDGLVRPLSAREQRMQWALRQQRKLERQHKVLADSDRLAALAASLSQEVATTDGKLSDDAIKRVNEVVKLAQSVQRNMRGLD